MGLLTSYLQSKSNDKLVKFQRKMAEEARERQRTQKIAGLNALGQSMEAFNPMNQRVASMVGPEAAFSPEAFASMTRNPSANPSTGVLEMDADLIGYTGTDPKKRARIDQYFQARNADEQRRQAMLANMKPLPQGPTPLRIPPPPPPRKY